MSCTGENVYCLYCTALHTEPTRKQFTVLVIKPDVVQEGKVDEILEKVLGVPDKFREKILPHYSCINLAWGIPLDQPSSTTPILPQSHSQSGLGNGNY